MYSSNAPLMVFSDLAEHMPPTPRQCGSVRMPFGKYRGFPLAEIPIGYLDSLYHTLDESWLKRRVRTLLDSQLLFEAFCQGEMSMTFSEALNEFVDSPDACWHDTLSSSVYGCTFALLVRFANADVYLSRPESLAFPPFLGLTLHFRDYGFRGAEVAPDRRFETYTIEKLRCLMELAKNNTFEAMHTIDRTKETVDTAEERNRFWGSWTFMDVEERGNGPD